MARLERPWLERMRRDMGSLFGEGGGVIGSDLGAWEKVQWVMGPADQREVFGVGTTIG